MRKIIVILIVFTSFFTVNLLGQRYTNNQFTVFSYSIKVDKNFESELVPFEGNIKIKTDARQNKITAFLIHNLYEIVTQTLTDSLNIYILPPNNLGDKAKYNDYGYPDINIKKAQRIADTKYFLKIEAEFENRQNDDMGNKLPFGSFMPQIKLHIDLYNNIGILPIKSAIGIGTTGKTIKTSIQFLNNLNFINSSEKTNAETLKYIITMSVNDAIYQIKHKK
jgi:hypothetical protein